MKDSLRARIRQRQETGSTKACQPPETIVPVWSQLTSDFPGSEVREVFGLSYLYLRETRPGRWHRLGDPEDLYKDLQLVYGIGPYYEQRLREEGYADLRDLCSHARWGRDARRIVRAIEEKDVRYLARRGASTASLLGYFSPEEIIFFDLETTGLSGTRPLFLIGTLRLDGDRLLFEQFLARCFEEERAVVFAATDLLAKYPVWVSFNGRAFDVPYLWSRANFFGLPCPQPQLHVDLLHTARKLYRDVLPNCRLVTLESYLLNRVRLDDVPSHLIPELYHRFVIEQRPELLTGILRHNIEDLHSLSKLIGLVKDEAEFQRKQPRRYELDVEA